MFSRSWRAWFARGTRRPNEGRTGETEFPRKASDRAQGAAAKRVGAGGFEPPFTDDPLAEPAGVLHELLEALERAKTREREQT